MLSEGCSFIILWADLTKYVLEIITASCILNKILDIKRDKLFLFLQRKICLLFLLKFGVFLVQRSYFTFHSISTSISLHSILPKLVTMFSTNLFYLFNSFYEFRIEDNTVCLPVQSNPITYYTKVTFLCSLPIRTNSKFR